MNEQIGKAIVGSLLREKRLESGMAQRDVAIELGLVNPNYLSMIEKGTHSVPLKRLVDFGSAYRLKKHETLAIVKMTSPDVWDTIISCSKIMGFTLDKVSSMEKEVEEVINAAAKKAGIDIISTKEV